MLTTFPTHLNFTFKCISIKLILLSSSIFILLSPSLSPSLLLDETTVIKIQPHTSLPLLALSTCQIDWFFPPPPGARAKRLKWHPLALTSTRTHIHWHSLTSSFIFFFSSLVSLTTVWPREKLNPPYLAAISGISVCLFQVRNMQMNRSLGWKEERLKVCVMSWVSLCTVTTTKDRNSNNCFLFSLD